MISKEEIEEYKNTLEELASDENVYNSIKRAVAGTFKYIQQLESDKQKLIDKLEEDIANDYHIKKPYGDKYCTYGVESISTKEYAQEILSIVKGEK